MERFKAKLLACVLSIFLALSATGLALIFFSSVGLKGVLPVIPSLLLSMLIATGIGLLFSKMILRPKSKKASFGMGVFFLAISLPLYDIGAVFFIKNQFQGMNAFQTTLSGYAHLYCMILAYSFIFIGSWLSVLLGLANMLLASLIQPLQLLGQN